MKFAGFFLSVLAFFVFVTTGHGQADETLVLALSFDDGQGDTAKDSSQYGFDASIQGPQWVDGKFNKALEFDGVDDFVEVADAPELRLLNGATIMVWGFIRPGGHASWPRFIHKADTTGGTGGWEVLLDRALGDAVRVCVGGACNSFVPLSSETWHHVAVTFDETTIKVYVEGEQAGEIPQPGPSVDTPDLSVIIGNSFNGQRQYQGIIDEVKVWSRALDANEIKMQMNLSVKDTITAVDPRSRVTATWAEIKNQ